MGTRLGFGPHCHGGKKDQKRQRDFAQWGHVLDSWATMGHNVFTIAFLYIFPRICTYCMQFLLFLKTVPAPGSATAGLHARCTETA